MPTALISQHAHFCPDRDHGGHCLAPETVTHGVTTWLTAGPSGRYLVVDAETVELDATALDALIAHLSSERQHI